MIEIDSSIINADILYERVKTSAKMKDIPREFYGDVHNSATDDTVSVKRIREEMIGLYQNLQMMNATCIIGEKTLASNRPIIGKIIVLCKKVFRKLTRWLFRTYYEQQTNFNEATTKTVSEMIRLQEMLIRLYEESERKEENHAD